MTKQIKHILFSADKDLGGFSVKRLLPSAKQKMVGPWIFFDHFGPAKFKKDQPGINVRPHPHVGLATVSYLFDGEIFHRDSLGSAQNITPGAINLMVAGKGITHSERESAETKAKDRTLEGLQLWHALPKEHEMTEPDFLHYESEKIPQTEIEGVKIRVMIGEAYNLKSPVKTFCQTLYCEARIPKGSELILPNEEEKAIYILDGEISCNSEIVSKNELAIFENNENQKITANSDAKIAIIGGEKFDDRIIYWNFVGSNKEMIENAVQKWENQEFDKVVGDEDEYIPL